MAKIGAVVPVYQVEAYLSRCVDSLLSQTYNDYEIILVDDGSYDMSGSICDEYAAKDKRVKVIHQQNLGLSAARNAGIDWILNNTTYQWITFIDSDDWVHPLYFEALYSAAMRDGVSVVIGGVMVTDGEQLPEIEDLHSEVHRAEEIYPFYGTIATVAWGKLYKKECFQNIRYPISKIHEDEYVTYKLLFNAEVISVIKQPLYAYFQNKHGIMNQKWTPKRLDAMQAIKEQVSFLVTRGCIECANIRFRDYVSNNLSNQENILNSVELSKKEKNKYVRRMKAELKKMLLKYRKFHWVSIRNGDIGMRAYGNVYKSVWVLHYFWKKLKNMIKRSE